MSKETVCVQAMSLHLLCVLVIVLLSVEMSLQTVADTKAIPLPRCRSLYTSIVPRSCAGRCHAFRSSTLSASSAGNIPPFPSFRDDRETYPYLHETKEFFMSFRDAKESSPFQQARKDTSPSSLLYNKESSPSIFDNEETFPFQRANEDTSPSSTQTNILPKGQAIGHNVKSTPYLHGTNSKGRFDFSSSVKEKLLRRKDAEFHDLESSNTSTVLSARFRRPVYPCEEPQMSTSVPLIPTRESDRVFKRTPSLSRDEDPSPPAWRRCQQSLLEQEVASLPCYCDAMCPLFGDCCADYYKTCLRINVAQLSSLEKIWTTATTDAGIDNRMAQLFSRMGCVQFLPNVYYRVVNKCDGETRRNQPANRRFCEGPTFPENITSISLRLLANERIVFKNAYCAFCNGFRLGELDLLHPVVYPECSIRVKVVSQVDLRRGFAADHCWLSFNDSARSVLRSCLPPPSLVQPACGSSSSAYGGSGGNISKMSGSNKQGQGQNEGHYFGYSQVYSRGHFQGHVQPSVRVELNNSEGQLQNYSQDRSEVQSGCPQKHPSCRVFPDSTESDNLPTNLSRFSHHISREDDHNSQARNFAINSSSESSPWELSTTTIDSADDPDDTSCPFVAAATLATTPATQKRKRLWSSVHHHALTSSRCLCRLYRYPVGVGGRQFFANLDCLACSVSVARPQIHVADRVCEDLGVTAGMATKKYWLLRGRKYGRKWVGGGGYGSNADVVWGGSSGAFPSSFRVFFQLTENDWDYQVKGQTISPQFVTCSDDKVYLPYYSDCVPLYCGPNAYPYRGRCLMKERLVADSALQPFPYGTTRFSITVTLRPAPSFSLADQNDFEEAVQDLEKAYAAYLDRSGYNINETNFEFSQGDCINTDGEGSVSQNCTDCVLSLVIKIEDRVTSTSTDQLVVLSQNVVNLTMEEMVPRDLAFDIQTVVVSNMLNIPRNWQCPNNDTSILRLSKAPLVLEVDDSQAFFLQTANTTFFNLENIGYELQTFIVSATNNSRAPVLLHALVCYYMPLLLCRAKGYIYLNASAFTVTNDTLVVRLSGETLNKSQFVVFDNGSAMVCSVFNFTHKEWVMGFAMLKDYMLEGTLSLASMSLSIVSLVTLLVIYSLLPELRNVPGVIVMCYGGTLLASQVLILLAGLPPRGWLCELHSCLSHTALLSTFMWKSALSFDLVFLLRLKSVKHSSRAVRARMLNCYAALGWLLPAVSVTIFWLLDHFTVYALDYGSRVTGVCWLESRGPNLYLVIVPLVVTWVFNFICFSLALRVIHRSTTRLVGRPCPGRLTSTTSNGGAEYQSKSRTQRAANWRRLAAYARISLLMGLSWIVCFLAAVFEVKELWWAHVVVNGAQGVYLLICFVLKRRVLVMLRARLRRRGREEEEEDGEVWRTRVARAAVASGEAMDCHTVTITNFTTLSGDSSPRTQSASSLS